MEEKIIISLGGSLVVPEEIDVEFLHSFRDLILEHVAEGKKFIITVGGGKICRKYQAAAKQLANPTDKDLDWIGIASLKLNAELLRTIFGKYVHPEVIPDLTKPYQTDKPIVIGSAWRPQASSDVDAVEGARSAGAKKVANLSNIDYVYDSDPKTNSGAQKIESISWKEYRAMIPKEWHPGLNSPFDPIASQMAEESGIEVAIMNGKDINNFAKYLKGEKFAGTIIK
jgi:uridylate kinase